LRFGQAKPSVLTRFGAPRRLVTSHQGRTGAGSPAEEAGEARRQAGPSSGERGGAAEGGACCAWPHHWRKAEEGTSQAARASPERREGKPRVKARTHEGTEETSLLGMGGRNRFLLIRRVGRGCQAKRRKVRILHRREREDHRLAQRDLQRTQALAAGRTPRRWTAREVLASPEPSVSA
jgi:hypothetical protein